MHHRRYGAAVSLQRELAELTGSARASSADAMKIEKSLRSALKGWRESEPFVPIGSEARRFPTSSGRAHFAKRSKRARGNRERLLH